MITENSNVMHTPEYNEPFTYDEVWQWMEEVYMWTGIPPTVAEITDFCHVGTEFAKRLCNEFITNVTAPY